MDSSNAGTRSWQHAHQTASQPAGQPADKPAGQPDDQPAGQLAGQPTCEPDREPGGQLLSQLDGQLRDQPIGESDHKHVGQPVSDWKCSTSADQLRPTNRAGLTSKLYLKLYLTGYSGFYRILLSHSVFLNEIYQTLLGIVGFFSRLL